MLLLNNILTICQFIAPTKKLEPVLALLCWKPEVGRCRGEITPHGRGVPGASADERRVCTFKVSSKSK